MPECLGSRSMSFDHLLDQIYSAPRTVELIAHKAVGRTIRQAETTMHAAPELLFGLDDTWVIG